MKSFTTTLLLLLAASSDAKFLRRLRQKSPAAEENNNINAEYLNLASEVEGEALNRVLRHEQDKAQQKPHGRNMQLSFLGSIFSNSRIERLENLMNTPGETDAFAANLAQENAEPPIEVEDREEPVDPGMEMSMSMSM